MPVYLGAPNIQDYAPHPDSYIDLRLFTGVEELAQHLQRVASDPVAYARLHAWRHRPLPPHMRLQV